MERIQINEIHISGGSSHLLDIMVLAFFRVKTDKLNLQVINETVRLANIVPGIFRKALRDIQFKGMCSPAILESATVVHQAFFHAKNVICNSKV